MNRERRGVSLAAFGVWDLFEEADRRRARHVRRLEGVFDILTYQHQIQRMTERTTVRLPEDLLTRAKLKALNEGRTLTSLIEEGLRRLIAEKPQQAKARVMPRISTARGGFADLGVDLADIQEAEDLEYVRRMREF